ncbi:MAG: hypothetical protein K2Q15_07315, partial [Burkholderiales bacterium]|nr:hypothetical protein [Burkholderiales bacterium]
FVLVGAAFFCFVSWPFKKGRPLRWLQLQNQRAEGTKKVFSTLVSAHGVQPTSNKIRGLHPPYEVFIE